MKCSNCHIIYRSQNGLLVKNEKKIILHFCSDACIEEFYWRKFNDYQERLVP